MKQIKISEITVSYQSSIPKAERVQISNSKTAYEAFVTNWDQNIIELQEEFKALFLNRNNEVLGTYSLARGGISSIIVDVRIIFATALKCAASSIIVAHNHPSMNLTPSEADKEITRKLKEGGKLLDIKVLDHLIVTNESYYSFADEGIL
ncbi:MAG: JAB domain-containing protein [Bacteroidetes bacterium]|nr:JAB domain-containing protein [Bacteroidota bacterium]